MTHSNRPNLDPNSARAARGQHVADAVIAAYLNEISVPAPVATAARAGARVAASVRSPVAGPARARRPGALKSGPRSADTDRGAGRRRVSRRVALTYA